jgi:hypothetical protein
MRHGMSQPALNALNQIPDRIESPATVLRTVEPWSSCAVLLVFCGKCRPCLVRRHF